MAPKIDDEARLFLGLSLVRGIGFQTLYDMGGVSECAQKIRRGDTDPYVQGVVEGARGQDVEQVLCQLSAPLVERLERAGIGLLRHCDEEFPEVFRELPGSEPKWIFYRGNLALLRRQSVAVVGTRNPTPVGEFLCRYAVAALAELDTPIVSGLAIGIDAVAHEWALVCGLPTVSVLGTGLLRTYPVRHASLADNIVDAGGLLLSEYLPDAGPSGPQFVARNRLQAALGACVIAPEWRKSSGTSHTVRHARKLSRPSINLRLADVAAPAESGVADLTFRVPQEGRRYVEAVRQAIETQIGRHAQEDMFGGGK